MLDKEIKAVLGSIRFSESSLAIVEQRIAEFHLRATRSNTLLTLTRGLHEFDKRMEKLEDAAINQIIGAASFSRRKEKLLLERSKLEDKIRKIEENRAHPSTLRRFLERVKRLAAHYEGSSP